MAWGVNGDKIQFRLAYKESCSTLYSTMERCVDGYNARCFRKQKEFIDGFHVPFRLSPSALVTVNHPQKLLHVSNQLIRIVSQQDETTALQGHGSSRMVPCYKLSVYSHLCWQIRLSTKLATTRSATRRLAISKTRNVKSHERVFEHIEQTTSSAT